MASYFNEMPPEIAAVYEEIERKRKINDAMVAKNIGRDRSTQYTPGRYSRAVPYNPLAGLTDLASAYVLKRKGEGLDEQRRKLGEDYEKSYQQEYADAMSTYRGREEAPAAYNEGQMGTGPLVPGFEADPQAAVMQAAGSADPRMNRVADAMLLQQRGRSGRGAYFKPIEISIQNPDGTISTLPGFADTRGTTTGGARPTLLGSSGQPLPPDVMSRVIDIKDPRAQYQTEFAKGAGGAGGTQFGQMGGVGPYPSRQPMPGAPQVGAQAAPTAPAMPTAADVAVAEQTALDTAAMKNPDSPEYREAKAEHVGDYEKYRTLINTKNKVLEDIRYILDPENRDAFEANFGGYNAYATRLQPGDDVQTMRAKIDSVKASLKAAGKQLATSDGTSIGQITEREWPILEQQIANVTPMLGEPGAEEAFTKVMNMLGGMQDTATSVYNKRWSASPFFDKYVDLSQPPPGVNPTIWNNMSEERKKEFLKAGEQ